MSFSATTPAAPTIVAADNYNAVAHFASGIVDGEPIDQIDTAYLSQDYIALYVDWDNMGMRAYRTEVRIVNPNGQVVGKIRKTILPSTGRYYTYYYYRPSSEDMPGDWTYQMYVDGRNAFEARIPVLAAE
jgi:predicted amidohydrolase